MVALEEGERMMAAVQISAGGMRILARRTIFALLLVVALTAAACGSSSPNAGQTGGSGSSNAKPASLNVELDWVPNPDHVGLYYAENKGLFSKQNLTVTFRTPSNSADPIKLVGLNKVDLAVSYEPEVFYGQQEGLPVKAVATVIPVPLNSLIVSPNHPITSLSQVRGMKIGVTGIPSDEAFFSTMLKKAGLTAADVTKVNVGFNLVTSLLSGKVDAIIGGYRNVEAIQVAQEAGKKPTVFPADQLGVPSYSELVLLANANRLQSDSAYSDAVRRFVKGLVAGTEGARKDPAGATQIMQTVSQYKPAFLQQSVPYTVQLLAPPNGGSVGCIDQSAWQSFGDWMKRNQLIKITPSATKMTTDSYLSQPC
jgi:putative hydroxymethylpyrimidine transport system substrate-binding protein